jgi:membrane peptidoglycan carboxypeptidase
MINEVGKGGLTEKQKKLPPALQKAILKKMKEDGKISDEEADAAYSKLLSKDDQKKKETNIEDEVKVVKSPKKDA